MTTAQLLACIIQHLFAWVHAENSKVSVTDLSSTNGTYIDDEELVPLRAVEMSVGKEVTFGKGLAIFSWCLNCIHSHHSILTVVQETCF